MSVSHHLTQTAQHYKSKTMSNFLLPDKSTFFHFYPVADPFPETLSVYTIYMVYQKADRSGQFWTPGWREKSPRTWRFWVWMCQTFCSFSGDGM